MIFNTSGGGGAPGWTDISDAFMEVNPDVDEIVAFTNGSLVYITFYCTNAVYSIEPPSDYIARTYAFGVGVNESLEYDAIAIAVGSNIQSESGQNLIGGTIIYPI